MKRSIFTQEHFLFKENVSRFIAEEVIPYYETWEDEGIIPKSVWKKGAQLGFLGMQIPTEYGGLGITDYRYNALLSEEPARAGCMSLGFGIHNEVCLPYLMAYANQEQKKRWFPKIISGEMILAIAMTEPGAGSDLQALKTTAVKEGDSYIVNGQKTFITNGIQSDAVIVAVKTDAQSGHKGISLLMVERGMEGFERGRNLKKIGLKAQDTAELFFKDVRVPKENLLGEEGRGFYYLMGQLPGERLHIALTALAAAEASFDITLNYCKEREAFGNSLLNLQNTKFKMAEMKTQLEITRSFIDECILQMNDSDLSTERASMAKWWCTDLQKRVADECLQLHGGYGYMREYPISRYYVDARIQSIYGGSNEIMKEIIGRHLAKE